MRILSAVGLLQMPPKEIEQPLHAAQMHRSEPPRAPGKPGLPLIVSLTPDDLDRLDFDTGEIDGSGRRSAHPLRPPTRKISTIGSVQLGQDHQSTPVCIGRSHKRAFDVARARRQDLSPFEPGPIKLLDQPQIVRTVCVPDSEQLALPSFLRDQPGLLVISIAKHKLDRIDMPLKEPPQRQAARTDRAKDFAQRQSRQRCPSKLERQVGCQQP